MKITDNVLVDVHDEKGTVIIPKEVMVIGEKAFAGSKIESVVLPSGLKRIENYAFEDCENLTCVLIPDGVETIGKCAFANCKHLKEVVLPYTVTSIESGAFAACKELRIIYIPPSVKNIGDGAFAMCKLLSSDIIPDSVSEVSDSLFDEYYDINNEVLRRCYSTRRILVPDGVTVIEVCAFRYCDNLEYVWIPASVKEIDAFYGYTRFGNHPSWAVGAPLGSVADSYANGLGLLRW